MIDKDRRYRANLKYFQPLLRLQRSGNNLSSLASLLLSPPSSKYLCSHKWPQLAAVEKRNGLERKREICAEKDDGHGSRKVAAGSDQCVLCTCMELPKNKILKFLNRMPILRLSIKAFPLKGPFQRNDRGIHVLLLKRVNQRALDSEQNMMYSQKTGKPTLLLPPAV